MKPNKKSRVKVTVEWGYESHTLEVPIARWRKIKKLNEDTIRGKGYRYEGVFYWDYWTFNKGGAMKLVVEYGGDGGVGYEGRFDQADIEGDPFPLEFTGSLMDGPHESIFAIAGIELSEEEHEKLVEVTNQRDLLNECQSVEEIETLETDTPCYSDRYFRYEIFDIARFRRELGVAIKRALSGLSGARFSPPS